MPKIKRDDITYEELYELYHEKKWSIQKCADKFDLSLAGMWGYFKRLCVPTDTKRRQPKEERWNYKGGRSIDSNGYVILTIHGYPSADSRGRVYEHRYVMEQQLGRLLEEHEEVHHKNEIKSDNRIENLEVKIESIHKSKHSKERYYLPKIYCSYEGCNNLAKARKLCNKHYLQEWKTGVIDRNEYYNHNLKKYWSNGMRKMFLIMGESGTGKTEVTKGLKNKQWNVLESYTTRPPRNENEFGHLFCNEEFYFKCLNDNKIVAYSYFANNHYFSTIDQILGNDIYVVDPDGIKDLKSKVKDMDFVTICLTISEEERVKRMEIRGDSTEKIQHRLSVDKEKFKEKEFDYMIPNKFLKSTVEIIESIIKKEKEFEYEFTKERSKK